MSLRIAFAEALHQPSAQPLLSGIEETQHDPGAQDDQLTVASAPVSGVGREVAYQGLRNQRADLLVPVRGGCSREHGRVATRPRPPPPDRWPLRPPRESFRFGKRFPTYQEPENGASSAVSENSPPIEMICAHDFATKDQQSLEGVTSGPKQRRVGMSAFPPRNGCYPGITPLASNVRPKTLRQRGSI